MAMRKSFYNATRTGAPRRFSRGIALFYHVGGTNDVRVHLRTEMIPDSQDLERRGSQSMAADGEGPLGDHG